MIEEGDAAVTLSFPHGGEQGKRAEIEIRCNRSDARVSVELSLEQVGHLVSGLGHIPAKVRHTHNLDKWGKQISRQTVTIQLSYNATDADRQALIEANTPDGFEYYHSHKSQSGFVIVYAKWE